MLWVKVGTHVIDHPRFLALGSLARDLWSWGMLYAGKHETDGAIPMAAVLSSPWGAGGKANIKLATELVEAGLWLRTDTGFSVCRWAEQGNQTKESLAEKREAGRVRKAKFEALRKNGNGVTNGVSNAFGSTSTSLSSPSGYGSGSQIASVPPEPETGVHLRADAAAMPDWFNVACDAAEMAGGGKVSGRPELWVQYLGSRKRKSWAMDHTDAVAWISAVVRTERLKASERTTNGRHIVQSGHNRAWKLPEGLE